MLGPFLKTVRDQSHLDLLPDVPESLLQAVPDELSSDHIRSLVTDARDGSDTTTVLSAVYTALKSNKFTARLNGHEEDSAILSDLALHVGQLMEPICSGAAYDEDSTDYASLSRNGLLGLHILRVLLALRRPEEGLVLPMRALLSVIAYTNRDDPWTTDANADLARSLLSDYFQSITPPRAVQPPLSSCTRSLRDARTGREPDEGGFKTERARFVADDVLTGFLRPLFAKSRPTTVTASGRPAAFPDPRPRYAQGDGFGGEDDVAATKPWKYARRYAITVFQWAVENADTELLKQHWPLYTPILLTLLDEPQPASLKLRSLSIFRDFWHRCPDGLLSRTGLADVFQQAIFPTVLSLPSLTPEDESCALLSAAYPALFDIAGLEEAGGSRSVEDEVQNAGAAAEATNDRPVSGERDLHSNGFSDAQRKFLDKIVREGIMVGYHHAKEHVHLVNLFCKTLRRLVSGMGIISVKYLQDIISMISEILVDPFGTKHPPTLLSAIQLLQAVLRTCWPRIPHYCNEIIKMGVLAWLNIEEDDSFPTTRPTKAELKQQLIRTIEILSAVAAAAKLDMSDRVQPLVTKDPQLRPLFTGCEAK
ncbi:hypothetical protein F4802DRAFT_395711 [Xylaria palmicola]|nr:hypothetical protein F4802DRAFT_395711 [Xylaria palmicola]